MAMVCQCHFVESASCVLLCLPSLIRALHLSAASHPYLQLFDVSDDATLPAEVSIMNVIVTGGGGYIGSHMCKALWEGGHRVDVIDNLSTGHQESVSWGQLHVGDIGDRDFVTAVFAKTRPDAVFHFAAKSLVGESNRYPADYYLNNAAATMSLLDQVRQVEGCVFIYSSTAAIFGNPSTPLITDDHPANPINTYGRSKLAIEHALRDFATAYGMSSASFRYFNAAGADQSATIGESHEPETHLIPIIMEHVLGRGGPLRIFGSDYDTADGTCIRDYVHVNDLCQAHLLGLSYIQKNPGAHFFNLGNGLGFSVRQVIDVAAQVTGVPIKFEVTDRRPGDPIRLVADSTRARGVLHWESQYGALEKIIESAWKWHQARRY
jgi:UDP-glucose 4-epimerase